MENTGKNEESPTVLDVERPGGEEQIAVAPTSPAKDLDFPEDYRASKADRPPSNIRQLTIKNLDTGEEFIIGENDPDFDFDTFEIGGQKPSDPQTDGKDAGQTENQTASEKASAVQQRKSWWRSFFWYIYGGSSEKVGENLNNMTEDNPNNRPKTPFTKLSSFKFRKELGKGAFGRVLLAEARTDCQLYALKIISKKNMRSSDRRQAKAERDILHAMTLKAPHPFTSGLKFAFQSENNLYLGMDYIPGGNLRELIKRFKYLPEDWVRFYAAELVLAISHLHSMNVLYRDIKPHNVMIDAKGHVILIDFGLSKQEISHPRGALSLVGTPDYSAPEVLRTGVQQIEAHNREKALRANGKQKKKGKKGEDMTLNETARLGHIGYGKAADWWSLGIMIYEMISGKPTFRGADLRETYQRILYSKLEFVPENRFSPAAVSLLEGLINRDPSLRLGAWENPPRDIMSSPFFASIEWDGIYDRVQDGPWLPELPSYFISAAKKAQKVREQSLSSPASPVKERGEEKFKLLFTPAPMDRYTPISDLELAKAGQPPRAPEVLQPQKLPPGEKILLVKEEEDDEEEEGEEDERDSEELHIRDSIFVFRDDVGNRLPDWSYIDANVLMNYLNDEKKDEERKEEEEVEGKKAEEEDEEAKKKRSNVKKMLEEAKEQREKAKASAVKTEEVSEETPVAVEQVEVVESPAETVPVIEDKEEESPKAEVEAP